MSYLGDFRLRLLPDSTETRAWTTGVYTNPFGALIAEASKLGAVAEFSFFEVPEAPGTPFDVFPGAPAVTDGATIVFKGNYTVALVGQTGVYFRDLVDEAIPSSESPTPGSRAARLSVSNGDFILGTPV